MRFGVWHWEGSRPGRNQPIQNWEHIGNIHSLDRPNVLCPTAPPTTALLLAVPSGSTTLMRADVEFLDLLAEMLDLGGSPELGDVVLDVAAQIGSASSGPAT